MRSMRSASVSMPCRIRKALNGEMRRAHVAQRHHARAADVGGRAQRLGVDHAVVADVGLVQALEARLVLGPRELAAVDDRAADAVAVAAEVLGQRMHDDVGAVLERAAQVRRGHGVVDDQRHAVACAICGQRGDIGDVAQRVADRLAEHRLGSLVDQRVEAARARGSRQSASRCRTAAACGRTGCRCRRKARWRRRCCRRPRRWSGSQ